MITFKKMREACWSGFKQVGMKKKGKKLVPNCVPEEDQKEELEEDYVVKYQHYKTSKMMAAAYKDKKDAEKFRDSVLKQGGKAILTTRAAFGGRVKEDIDEAKAPFRLSYDARYGKHAGFEDAKTLADLQNKAANLRKRGFVINKMGRNTSPVKEMRIRPKRMVESDPTQYGPDKVAKAMKIAVKSDGNYSGAVREIEKIGKGLSKVSTIARALKTANENKNVHEGARLVYETIKGLKNKAEKTGMPYSILKKVYDRGMAAWRGGHRPGTTQQQWAFARVNSFVTKSSGTWGGADKDLAKQVRGSKK